jgi:hypothetical protein
MNASGGLLRQTPSKGVKLLLGVLLIDRPICLCGLRFLGRMPRESGAF